ncbi:hypothetical protein CIPAW_05G149000 [Carya illinoinensis]|uniref:DUF642 domain-containing protein n=1 Tax=Carya illinoinensis TaxID=32201 RepID=A0A8T1QIZ7_CARIL|nr:hypothetical protein CIPAW_05G149000 [Carya illinoinensis]
MQVEIKLLLAAFLLLLIVPAFAATYLEALSKWEINGLVEYISGKPQPGGMYFIVAHGVHVVRLGNEASISQTIKVKLGALYALTFGASRTCTQEEVLQVSMPPQKEDLPLQTLHSSNGGDTYAWGFITTSNVVIMTFHNPGTQEDPACRPLLDAVAIKELFPPWPQKTILIFLTLLMRNTHTSPLFPLACVVVSKPLCPTSSRNSFWEVFYTYHASPHPGWIIESLKVVKFINSKHFSVPFGLAAVKLVAGRESVIAQILRTLPSRFYNLTFTIGDAKNGCHGLMMVEAFAAKDSLKTASFRFKALSSRTKITFFNSFYHTRINDFGSLSGAILDQVRVVPIA